MPIEEECEELSPRARRWLRVYVVLLTLFALLALAFLAYIYWRAEHPIVRETLPIPSRMT